MSLPSQPQGWSDRLWHSLLMVLLTIGAIAIAWKLIHTFLGPLLVLAGLLLVLRIILFGFRSRRGW